MIRYFNVKTVYGIETVDQINTNDFIGFKAYNEEKQRLIKEYRLCGMNVYISQRQSKK